MQRQIDIDSDNLVDLACLFKECHISNSWLIALTPSSSISKVKVKFSLCSSAPSLRPDFWPIKSSLLRSQRRCKRSR